MRALLAAALIGSTSLTAAAAAHAEGWIVTVGGRVAAAPPYEGANHDVIAPSPTFSLRREDSPDRFEPPDGGTTIALLSTRYIVIGPMARFRYSRGNQGNLTGFDKIDWAAEPGGFVELWPTNFIRGRAEVRRGVVGHHGWVGDGALDLVYTGPRWDASIGGRVGYGDAKYMDTYFGVTPAEALASPLITTPYEPGKGRRYTGLEAAVAYRLVGGLWTTVDVGYHRLSDKAAFSPIVMLDGKRDQFSGGVELSYSFGVGTHHHAPEH